MKKNKSYTIVALLLIFFLGACERDLLDQYPQDTLSDVNLFQNASDFKLYMNGMYATITRGLNQRRWRNLENGTDNYFAESPASSIEKHSESGEAPATSGLWNGSYDNIRKVNYLIGNKDRIGNDSPIANHYIGEAYYVRAWHYFRLLQNFGGVPYIDEVLTPGSEELYSARESRDFIATKIIEDLDQAIGLLNWLGKGEATKGRINKECALLMKTRVGLYEGSWEYYHGKKDTPFKVSGSDGTTFLNKAVEAGNMLIANQGPNIYIGSPGSEYSEYFILEDYGSVPGAFFYRHWDADQGQSHSLPRASVTSFRSSGLTKSAVHSYLMSDGKPAGVSPIEFDENDQADFIAKRDPRLYQTIYSPARGPFNETYANFSSEYLFGNVYAAITLGNMPEGGYTIFKGAPLDAISLDQCNVDDLILRYEEALLNYVEAKAILGTVSQSDIDNTVNVIRDRVGMQHMSLSEVNGWSFDYSLKLGYDPNATNIINEIRRERRVELLLEGFRQTDLKRWAIFEDVINGYKPVGAPYQEMADYFSDPEELAKIGFSPTQEQEVQFQKGVNVDELNGYINPFFRESDFTPEGRGYYIDPGRDYLNAIPKQEIDLYQEKGGVTLEQNPGWF